ncbi:alanine racemase [Nisaea acidiphila]|uniref:Alanine racemase n=1 Tax=Nisaea acidiphila TaxID=1862145 RepID=A0A9J7AS45_9PROT|nr:alanine racemase [Nisaea acidiphila]UUX49377.1 alanine racemase [Nisaea acidiphila]
MPDPSPATDGAGAASELVIDLDAIKRNYLALKQRLGGAECGAAVKADAYGTGADKTAPALFEAGCRTFFVATVDEGIALRKTLPPGKTLPRARIAVLNGLLPGTEEVFPEFNLIPVINDLEQAARIRQMCVEADRAMPAMLHIDTGMNRLGLSPADMDWVAGEPDVLAGPDWLYALSHLASADEPERSENPAQLALFREQCRRLQRPMKMSLANSAGIFLGPDYHFDLARPGFALYGGRVEDGKPSPMEPVVRLRARILQVRAVRAGDPVGYGGTFKAEGDSRIATVAAGYADGYLRSLSNSGGAYIGNQRLPVVGRVSMDMLAVDVSKVDRTEVYPGGYVDLLGPQYTVNDAADAAGTIGYEILTGLGHRYTRRYIDVGSGDS